MLSTTKFIFGIMVLIRLLYFTVHSCLYFVLGHCSYRTQASVDLPFGLHSVSYNMASDRSQV